MPDATTLSVGDTYYFNNNLTVSSVQINAHDGSTSILSLQAGGDAQVVLLNNSTTNGTWDVHSFVPSSASWGTATLSFNNTASISGSVSWTGTKIGTAYGGTGLSGSTPFTANGILYASSASALATSSGLTFDGTNFATTGIVSATKVQTLEGVSGSIANGATATLFVLPSSGSYLVTARQDSAGNGGIRASAIVMQGTSSNGLSSLFAVGGATLVQGTGFNVDLTNTAGGSATFRWAYIKLSS